MAHWVLDGAPSVPSRGAGTLPDRVLDALDVIHEYVMELTRELSSNLVYGGVEAGD